MTDSTKTTNEKLFRAWIVDKTPLFSLPASVWGPAWTFYRTNELPSSAIYATAFGVVRDAEDRVLLVFNSKREIWELPGGHLSTKELSTDDPVAGFRREAKEEAGVDLVDVVILGVGHIKKPDDAPDRLNRETGIPYPAPNDFMIFLTARVGDATALRSEGDEAVVAAEFVSTSEARQRLASHGMESLLDYA